MKVIVTCLIWFLCFFVCRCQVSRSKSRCVNPNQKQGTCISIYDCQPLLSVVSRKPLAQIDRKFVSESECQGGIGNGPFVCCTEDTGYRRLNGREQSTSTILFPSPPQRRQGQTGFRGVPQTQRGQRKDLPVAPACGAVAIENKIYGGSDASLFEFPWMVLLEYGRRNGGGGRSFNCAGALINQRYVVTAAHCVMGAIVKQIGSIVSILLGEHDITQQVDCNQFGCSSEAIRVGIEQVVPYENYVDAATNKQHDIALIRMDRDITFSDSIRPICLPTRSEAIRAGTQLIVAGWGRTLNAPRSAIKQKLTVPVVDQAQCRRKFQERKVNVVDSQICAGGRFAEDSCDGDSGGPLMRFSGSSWILEGIVSFGVKCGLKDWPAVYTRVGSYSDWIRSKIRA